MYKNHCLKTQITLFCSISQKNNWVIFWARAENNWVIFPAGSRKSPFPPPHPTFSEKPAATTAKIIPYRFLPMRPISSWAFLSKGYPFAAPMPSRPFPFLPMLSSMQFSRKSRSLADYFSRVVHSRSLPLIYISNRVLSTLKTRFPSPRPFITLLLLQLITTAKPGPFSPPARPWPFLLFLPGPSQGLFRRIPPTNLPRTAKTALSLYVSPQIAFAGQLLLQGGLIHGSPLNNVVPTAGRETLKIGSLSPSPFQPSSRPPVITTAKLVFYHYRPVQIFLSLFFLAKASSFAALKSSKQPLNFGGLRLRRKFPSNGPGVPFSPPGRSMLHILSLTRTFQQQEDFAILVIHPLSYFVDAIFWARRPPSPPTSERLKNHWQGSNNVTI